MGRPKSREIPFWHRRYLRQAAWTRGLRHHLYRKIGLARCRDILELGCGTGAISEELHRRTGAFVCGLDRGAGALALAKKNYPNIACVLAEARSLPMAGNTFDLIVTHYFWMWLPDPEGVMAECLRVLRPKGYLAALAEPDYGGRTDHPIQLSAINEQLTAGLLREGADPFVGKKLEDMFRKAGFRTEAGSMEQGWKAGDHRREFAHEWEMIEEVLKVGNGLKDLKEIERSAIKAGARRSMMPIHWATGRKKA